MKPGFSILSTSLQWMAHSTKEAETWPDQFMERMEEFTKLSELEQESNKEKSNEEPIVDLDGDTSFDTF